MKVKKMKTKKKQLKDLPTIKSYVETQVHQSSCCFLGTVK